MSNLHSSGESLVTMKTRAKTAEAEVLSLQAASINEKANWSLKERHLQDEIQSIRRDYQRQLDLLNEESGKMDEFSMITYLH